MPSTPAPSLGITLATIAAKAMGTIRRTADDLTDAVRLASRRQRALLALAAAAPLTLATAFALHQRSEEITQAHETAQRSVVALEQHAANVLDAHALILRQLDILTHGRSWDQVRKDELVRITLAGFSRELTQVSTGE